MASIAFDQAWDLAKMPLVPGSIRYLGNKIPPRRVFENKWDKPVAETRQTSGDDLSMNPWTRHPHRYTADFLDPVSIPTGDQHGGSVFDPELYPEGKLGIIPMHGNYYPPVGSDEAFIRVGMEDFMWKKNLLIRPPHNYSAEFYDPVEDRIIPMGARYYPPNDNDEAFIRVNMDDEDSENLPNRSSASASPYFAGVEGIRDKWRGHIGVHPQRMGKGTAIYDMIAAILDHRSPHGAVLRPNDPRSLAAEALWRGKEEGWPVVQRIDDRISVPHRFSTD